MPRNGSGIYGLPAGTTAVPNTPIESARYNAATTDIAKALTDSVNVQGSAPFQGDQPMGNHKLTGLSAGLAATDSPTLSQVQSGIVAHAVAVGGSADAIALSFSPPFTAYAARMRFRFSAGSANATSSPTVNVDGLGAKTIKKLNGRALIAGDIAGAGHIVDCVYDGTDVLMVSAAAVISASTTVAGLVQLATAAEARALADPGKAVTPAALGAVARLKLGGDATIYVRVGGDDDNDGSANDDAHAVATISRACEIARALDVNGQLLTIQVGDGTFSQPIVIGAMLGVTDAGKFVIKGNSAMPGNVVILAAGANCFTAAEGARVTIKDMELRVTGSGNGLEARNGGYIRYGNLQFGAIAGSGLLATDFGKIECIQDYWVAGNSAVHFNANRHGIILCEQKTITLVGPRAFNIWVTAAAGSVSWVSGNTYIGSATGMRFFAQTAGGVFTGGVTQPGSQAGQTNSPGYSS